MSFLLNFPCDYSWLETLINPITFLHTAILKCQPLVIDRLLSWLVTMAHKMVTMTNFEIPSQVTPLKSLIQRLCSIVCACFFAEEGANYINGNSHICFQMQMIKMWAPFRLTIPNWITLNCSDICHSNRCQLINLTKHKLFMQICCDRCLSIIFDSKILSDFFVKL